MTSPSSAGYSWAYSVLVVRASSLAPRCIAWSAAPTGPVWVACFRGATDSASTRLSAASPLSPLPNTAPEVTGLVDRVRTYTLDDLEAVDRTAAVVVAERGAVGASLDKVGPRGAAPRSQLCHYFDDKSDLLRGVAQATNDKVLNGQRDLFVGLVCRPRHLGRSATGATP